MAKLLIVDDELDVKDFAANFFRKRKFEVFTASNGNQALDLAEKQNPDLILLDIKMQGMDGIEVLKRAKTLDPNMGVIMITALQDEELGREALKLGAADYITKPVDFEYLDTSLLLKLSTMLE